MQFIKSSLWAGLVIGFKALGSIVINKLISSFYQDPKMFALLAHFQNMLGIFLTIPSDGVNQGTIKYIADKKVEKGDAEKIFYAGIWLNIFIFLLSTLTLFLFKEYFIQIFAQGIEPLLWIALVLLVLLIQLFNLYFLSLLLARHELKLYAILNIASTIVGIAIIFICFNYFSFYIVLLAVGFAPSSLFFVNAFFINKNYYKIFRIKLPDAKSLKLLGHFILMASSIMVFEKFVSFLVRQYAMSSFTTYQTGLWQSVVKFSDYYIAAFISLMGMVYYPKISQLINEKEELQKYVKSVLKISVPVILIGLVSIFFLREQILILFFDKRFLGAERYFMFQLLGDFFRMTSFILGYIITAQARTKLFIGSQAGSAFLYVALIFICTDAWGMDGFPIAHAISYAIYFCFIFILYRKLIFS